MTKLPERAQKKIVVVDGYSFVFRAYYSMPALSRPEDGVPVGAVYGFTSMLMRLLLDMMPSHVVVVFDAGGKNHRHKIFPEYKANRPPAPEDLIPQFPLVREAAKALNIEILEQEGYEADDIIATLARVARQNEEEVVIVSSDKDLMQLVNHHIVMYDAMRSKVIGEDEVKEKFGVVPSLIGDLLALVGDTADNIPGVPGIGPKTAAELLNTYGNLSEVINNADKIKQPKRRNSIIENKDSMRLSRQLVELLEDVKLDVSFNQLKTKAIDSQKLISFLRVQNFKSLIVRAEKEFDCKDHKEKNVKNEFDGSKIIVIDKIEQLDAFLKKAALHGKCSIFIQNNFQHNLEIQNVEDIDSMSLFIDEDHCYFISFKHSDSGGEDLFSQAQIGRHISFVEVIKYIMPVLQDVSIKKIFYDYKKFLWLVGNASDDLLEADDVMLLSYSLGAGLTNSSLGELIQFHLKENDMLSELSGITKLRGFIDGMTKAKKADYVVKQAFYIKQIFDLLIPKVIQNHVAFLYYSVDKPLSCVVSKMERYGIKIDGIKISKLKEDLDKQLEVLSKEIYKIAGCEFNIASTQQLSDVLFNKMSLKTGKKSKAGNYSTGVGILEELQIEGHHIADLLLEWRKLYKLKTTYTDSLLKQTDTKSRIHTNFSLAYTVTGRFSSTAPNLQNIPIKTELGNKIRGAFVASDGFKLVSADYSQVELRILADIANVPSLKKAFIDGKDVHKITASEVFDVSYDKINSDLRRKAKIINFSIIYGVSSYGLARNLGIPVQKAKEYIDEYFRKYPEILDYMENTKAFARKYGCVSTIMGRKCFIRKAGMEGSKMFLDRSAINAPIQGSNADIIRKVMGSLSSKMLNESRNDIRMLLQVHDELLFEIRDGLVEDKIKKIKDIMEWPFLKEVPLVVDFNISSNWIKN